MKIYYHFNNDFRSKDPFKYLQALAHYFNNGEKIYHQVSILSGEKGWKSMHQTLFGIYSDKNNNISYNTDLVLGNKLDMLFTEFIKKFQYPFPKKTRMSPKDNKSCYVYKYQEKKNYQIAPLRILIKLLFYLKVYLHKSYVTVEEFKDYILGNKKLVIPSKHKNYNIPDLVNDIQNGTCKGDFNKFVDVCGGNDTKKRFVPSLLEMIGHSSFITYDNTNKLIKLNIKTRTEQEYITNIISYNSFWNYKNYSNENDAEKSYIQYMQYSYSNDFYLQNKYYLVGNLKHNNVGKNIIVFGAPGVGKSYNVKDIINDNGLQHYNNENSDEYPNVLRTTLYSGYDYTDFIGQIMPSEDKNHNITYKETAGIFTKALMFAYSDLNKPVFLILEEMSRCNISSVFGDVFQLLDRGSNGYSIYGINNELMSEKIYGVKGHKIRIPKNLFIIGTLNTSDQSIYPMDTAFKRRFEWKYIPINNGPIQPIEFKAKIKTGTISWDALRKKINKFIVNKMNLKEDKQLGKFFINFHVLDSHNRFRRNTYKATNNDCKEIKNKLLFYLWNDVDKIYNELSMHSNNMLLKNETFSKLYHDYNPEKDVLSIFSKEFINDEIND